MKPLVECSELRLKMSSSSSRPSKRSSLDRFFAGLSEFVFHGKLGVTDVHLVDYVSDLMLRFTRLDSKPSPTIGSQSLAGLFSMLVEADRRVGVARRDLNRHIGDFTLFWSGMYPEALRGHASPAGGQGRDVLLDYCAQGKRAYAIAGDIDADADRPSCELMQRLSDEFEMCAYGLREVRRAWEDMPPADDLMLQ